MTRRAVRKSPGQILSPERFERFASTAFRASDVELREAAQAAIIEAYGALYGSRYGKLWTACLHLQAAFRGRLGDDNVLVSRQAFNDLCDAVALVREHDLGD